MEKPQHIRLYLKSNSTTQLDKATQDIKMIVKQNASVVSGPVCFKGKRLLDIYICNSKTIDKLLAYNINKKVKTVAELKS